MPCLDPSAVNARVNVLSYGAVYSPFYPALQQSGAEQRLEAGFRGGSRVGSAERGGRNHSGSQAAGTEGRAAVPAEMLGMYRDLASPRLQRSCCPPSLPLDSFCLSENSIYSEEPG